MVYVLLKLMSMELKKSVKISFKTKTKIKSLKPTNIEDQ